MRKNELSNEYCSIARAGAQIADAWTLLILRELLLSNRTFEGIRRQTGMAPGSLNDRLSMLIEAGILSRRSPEDKPRKAQYLLTEKGQDLWPVIVAIKQWGDKWHGPWRRDLPPVILEHKGCGNALNMKSVCACCGETVTAPESRAVVSPTFAAERRARDIQGKADRRLGANQ